MFGAHVQAAETIMDSDDADVWLAAKTKLHRHLGMITRGVFWNYPFDPDAMYVSWRDMGNYAERSRREDGYVLPHHSYPS